ncbi:hypothetical protein KHQ89_01595 [Mycoplasmatota bacterium]|nr:hypothetical protein KHQ89_01595 [Mycoplasmatota bacterium]
MLDLKSKKAGSMVDRKRAKIFIVKYKRKEKVILGQINDFTGYANLMMIRVEENQMVDVKYRVLEGSCALGYTQKKQFHVITEEDCEKQIKLDAHKGFIRFRVIGEKASVHLEIKMINKDI